MFTNAQSMITDPSQGSLSFALALPIVCFPTLLVLAWAVLHFTPWFVHGLSSRQIPQRWCVMALEIYSRRAAKFPGLQLLA